MLIKTLTDVFSVGVRPDFSYQETLRYRFANIQIAITLFFNVIEIFSNPAFEAHVISGISMFVCSLSIYLNSTQKQHISGLVMTILVWAGLAARILLLEQAILVVFFLPITFFLAPLLNRRWLLSLVFIFVLNLVFLLFAPIEFSKIVKIALIKPDEVIANLIHSMVYCIFYFVGVLFLFEKDSFSKLLKSNDPQAKSYLDLQTLSLMRTILPLGTWVYDFSNGKITWDRNTFQSFGLEYGKDIEPDYSGYQKFIHPDDWPKHSNEVKKTMAGEQHYFQSSMRHLQPDGSFKWMKSYGKVLSNENGKPLLLLGGVINIDEELKHRRINEHIVKFLQVVAENNNLGVMEIEGEIILKTNQLTLQWLDYEPSELYKRNIANFLKERTFNESNNVQVFLSKDNFEVEIETSKLQFEADGKSRTIILLNNLSQQRSNATTQSKTLKENAELWQLNNELIDRFDALSNTIDVGVLVLDKNDNIFFANEKIRNTFYNVDFVELNSLALLFNTGAEFNDFVEFLSSVEIKNQQLFEFKGHVGQKVEFLVSVTKLPKSGIRVLSFKDLSEQRLSKKKQDELEEDLRQAKTLHAAFSERISELESELKDIVHALYDNANLLKENEQNVSVLAEASIEAILFFKGDRIVYFNAQACKKFQYSANEIKEISIFDLFSPSDRTHFSDVLISFDQSTSINNFIFLTKNGKPFFGKANLKRTEFKGNEVYVLNISDQTELMVQKRALEKTERNLLNILQEMPVALFITFEDDLVFHNQSSLELFGEEFTNNFNWFKEQVLLRLERDQKTNLELFVNNGIKKLLISHSRIRFNNKKSELWVLHELTEKQQIQKNLNHAKALQESIINIDDIGFWAVDKNNKLLFFNPYHAKMTEMATGKKMNVGVDYREFLFDYNIPIFEELIEKAFQGKSEKLLLNNSKGSEIEVWGEFVSKPVFVENKIEYVLVVGRELTDLIKTQIELENKGKLLSISQNIAKIGSYIYDVPTQKIHFSDKVFQILNAKENEILDVEWLKMLIGEKAFEESKRFLLKKILKKEAASFDVMTINPETVTKWLRVNAIPVVESDNIVAVNGSIQDISEYKLSELRVLENNQILDTIMEKLPVAFQLFDLNGYSLRHNEIQDVLLTNTFQNENANLFNLLNEIQKKNTAYYEVISNSFQNKEETFIPKMAWGSQTNPLYFDTLFSPIFSDNNDAIAVVMLGIDVTDLVKQEELVVKKQIELESSHKEASDYKLMALRAAMNPHFLFNVLNSIQFLINKNDKLEALANISLFSKLMRKVLASSGEQKVTLASDLELLDYYIRLENLRFENKFSYFLELRLEQNSEEIWIPPLILQPIVENAIIHGLMNKISEDKFLNLTIVQEEKSLKCVVEDNGVGRMKNQKTKPNKSFGLELTIERLKLVNIRQKSHLCIEDLIDDVGNPMGTRVTLFIEL